ncbi:hypothetical protein RvY_10561 [Ramazzottius varieornatus]|uniref:HORMA domain-containing protein n=1 Tax=Ramazzottius varieornatus TaxID=947166 RepID=A0A1D1VD67_RAMVA|nr:hypothetical protein RvY_10561 [Ramazzottius varieornatus]
MSLNESIISRLKDRATSVQPVASGDIVNVATSAQATKRLLVYSLSKVLSERHLFPEDCFKERELRVGLTAPVFKGPQPSPAAEDEAGKHAKRCLDAFNAIVPRLNESEDMADVVLQLFDVKDPQTIYEEWRFEVKYKPLPVSPITNKKRGSVSSKVLSTTQAVLCNAEQYFDVLEKAAADVKKKTDVLKLFDFADKHKDVRFRVGVSLSEAAVQQEPLPIKIFEEQASGKQKTHSAEPVLRLRVGSYDLPFHRFDIKIKSTLFKNPTQLDKALKENQQRKRY